MDYITECPSCRSSFFQEEITVRAHLHNEPDHFRFVRCGACGLLFLNPRVPERFLGKYYRDYYLPYRGPEAWGKWARLVETDLEKTDRQRVRLTRRFAGLEPASLVLDIGCGKPTFLEKLTRETGCRGTGTDFTDAGWKEDPERWKDLDLKVGDINQLDLSLKADAITMWHYLEHDYRPRETLEGLKKLSHKNTRLIIEVPNHNSLTRKIHGPWWEGYHSPRHASVFDPTSITRLLENAGWNVSRVLKWGTLDAYNIHWMSRMEKKGIDWSGNMENHFIPFVAGKVLSSPLFLMKKWIPLAVMVVVARPAS